MTSGGDDLRSSSKNSRQRCGRVLVERHQFKSALLDASGVAVLEFVESDQSDKLGDAGSVLVSSVCDGGKLMGIKVQV